MSTRHIGSGFLFCWDACGSLGGLGAHATWRVRAAGRGRHALARIVHRGLGLLHRVNRHRVLGLLHRVLSARPCKQPWSSGGYWHLAARLCVRHGTHSFVSLILSAVFSIVSFSIVSFTVVSLLMIDSLCTRHGRRRWWMACTMCVLMKAARCSEGWRVRLDSIRILDAPVANRPTVSQWPVTRARQPAF